MSSALPQSVPDSPCLRGAIEELQASHDEFIRLALEMFDCLQCLSDPMWSQPIESGADRAGQAVEDAGDSSRVQRLLRMVHQLCHELGGE
ncbi:MAG: hypothetical protein ABSG68_25680 [Thermoguttaceae bacterium]